MNTTPIASSASSYQDKVLYESDSGHWVLQCHEWHRMMFGIAFSLGLILLLPVLISYVFLGNRDWDLLVGLLGSGLFLIVGGVGLMLGTSTFVRYPNTMTRWYGPIPRSRSLDGLVALQLIPGRFVRGKKQPDGSKSSGYRPFELNLVFEGGERVNLLSHADVNSSHASGRQLAEYFDVPFHNLT